MKKANEITPEILQDLLRYDAETGKLYWKMRTPEMFKSEIYSSDRACTAWNSRYGCKEAFTACDTYGYKHGHVFRKLLPAHRVIWAIYYGKWPDDLIDHIDRNQLNNKIGNLRQANRSQNRQNTSSKANGSSRYLGVSLYKTRNKWVAQIKVNGKSKTIGYFDDESDAAAAYAKAAIQAYGEFAGDVVA